MILLTLIVVWSVTAVVGRREATSHRTRRLVLACAVAVSAAALDWTFWSRPRPFASDLTPVWASARALVHRADPYDAVGPGRAYDTRFPQIYPLTAMLPIAPIASLPIRWVDPLFTATAFGLFAWAVTRRRILAPPLAALVSLPGLMALQTSQWSPLLAAAALLPAAGWLLAAKPTIGLALFAAFPRRATAIGCGVMLAISIAVWPTWIGEWRATLASAPHVVPPIARIGGPLMLLGLWKWRRADARLLVALSCVPQTTALYETIPLFLVAETWPQASLLWSLALLSFVGQWLTGPYPTVEAHWASGAQWIVALMYLPSLAMVLGRPNVTQSTDRISADRSHTHAPETRPRAHAPQSLEGAAATPRAATTTPAPGRACTDGLPPDAPVRLRPTTR